jgi:hypothetical protein
MKKPFLKIMKLFAIFAVFLNFGCSKDFYDEALSDDNVKISKVSISDPTVLNNYRLMQEIQKIKQKQENLNTTNRLIHDTINGFYFDDEKGLLIEKDNGYKSFTFPIYRDAPSEKLENIVFSLKEDNEYEPYLSKYTLSEQQKQLLKDGKTPELSASEIEIIYLGSLVSAKCGWNLEQRLNDAGNYMIMAWTYIECGGGNEGGITIDLGYGSGGSGGVKDNDPSPNSSVGGMLTSPVGTNPHGGGGGGYDLTPPNPCENLKKLFDPAKANIKPNIVNDLQPNIAVNPSGEKGVSLSQNSAGEFTNNIIPPVPLPPIFIPTYSDFYSAIHTHPLDTSPMFSWSDVVVLNSLNNHAAPHNQGMASFLLVCQDDNGDFQTYAIVFEPDSLNETIDQFMNNPENIGCTVKEIAGMMDKKLGEEYDKEYNSPNPNYERSFLKFMSSSNVSLYKANSTLTNWSKLTLSNNSATARVISKNCN